MRTYNAKGEPLLSVLDLNTNGQVDLSGTDRITATLRDVITYSGYPVTRTRTFVHTTDAAPATNLVATVQTSTDGLRSWRIRQRDSSTPVVTSTLTAYGAGGARTETLTQPDGSYSPGVARDVQRDLCPVQQPRHALNSRFDFWYAS